MGGHFTFGDGGDVHEHDKAERNFTVDRSGRSNEHFSSSSGEESRGRGERPRGRGGAWRGRGGGDFRGRGTGNFRGRGGRGNGNFRGRGNGNFRGRGRGRGGVTKNFRNRDDHDQDAQKEKLGVLSDETMAYYRQVSATMEAGFDDDDPEVKKNFLDNVYQAVKDEGVKVSQNQTVSYILEGLLYHSQPTHLRILFCEFCNHIPTVTFDRFASHVFQSLIQFLPDMYDDTELESEEKNVFKVVVEKLCEFCLSSIKQLLTDTYGSHILRALMVVLGGVEVNEEVIRSLSSRNKRKDFDTKKNLQLRKNNQYSKELCSDFQSSFDTVKSEVVSILNEEASAGQLTDPNFCLVLQTFLLILHQSNPSEYQQISHMLAEKARPAVSTAKSEQTDGEEADSGLPALVQDSVGSHLIELVVGMASELEIPKLYKRIFRGQLSAYALHPVANYVLQKLIVGLASSPKYLMEMVMEVTKYMEDILACNHIGIITKMAEACRGHSEVQKRLMQALLTAFHCDDGEEMRKKITPLIASMSVYEVFFPSEASKEQTDEETPSKSSSPRLLKTVNIHGSLLLQQLVHFDNPKYIVNGLLALTPAELSTMASDQCGSHVIEAFFNSASVWAKQKDEFIRKLQGFYINIACNKNGSRCLEGVWKGCAIKNKMFIVEELLKSQQRLQSDRFGKFLFYNFKLLQFSTRKNDWVNYQSGINKKEKLLQDILEGGSGKKQKSRKRPADQSFGSRPDVDVDITTPAEKKSKSDNTERSSKKDKKKMKKK